MVSTRRLESRRRLPCSTPTRQQVFEQISRLRSHARSAVYRNRFFISDGDRHGCLDPEVELLVSRERIDEFSPARQCNDNDRQPDLCLLTSTWTIVPPNKKKSPIRSMSLIG